jgi:putative two-component system response regulator
MTFAGSADEAIDLVNRKDFDAIVVDLWMPGKGGFELLEALADGERSREVPVIMLTGGCPPPQYNAAGTAANSQKLKRRALEHGAVDLLHKPVHVEDLLARIDSLLRLKSYQDQLRSLNAQLDAKVKERTQSLEHARLDIIWRLAKAGEYRNEETGDHVIRVGCYSRILGERMGMPHEAISALFLASPLHDIGKIGVPDQILLKTGPLDPDERHTMERHSVIGSEILLQEPKGMMEFLRWTGSPSRYKATECPLRGPAATGEGPPAAMNCGGDPYVPQVNPLLEAAASIALSHHERWDGGGYPMGLAGKEIPIESRVVGLADTFDALCSVRPYKPAYGLGKAVEIMRHESGRHFDPEIHNAFESAVEEFVSVQKRFSDSVCQVV